MPINGFTYAAAAGWDDPSVLCDWAVARPDPGLRRTQRRLAGPRLEHRVRPHRQFQPCRSFGRTASTQSSNRANIPGLAHSDSEAVGLLNADEPSTYCPGHQTRFTRRRTACRMPDFGV